jgi:NitT/TauT family transport system permease protein
MVFNLGSALKFVILILLAIYIFQLVTQRDQPVWVKSILANPDTPNLPYLIFRTLLRMVAAYALVVLFAIPYGIIAGIYKGPQKIMLPLLDILQSIPVLGYLPPTILFFTARFSSTIALELASIILIFTGEAWAVTFGVYGGVRNIPEDIKRVGRTFGMTGWKYIRYIVLPSIFPPFITGSILAWGGGWYFLIAAEFMTYGGVQYTKDFPGLGNYIAKSVYVYHDIYSALFGLTILVAIIYLINTFVWRPLMAYSDKFKHQTMDLYYHHPSTGALVVRIIEFARKEEGKFYEFLERHRVYPTICEMCKPLFKLKLPKIKFEFKKSILRHVLIFSILFIITMLVFGFFVADALKKPFTLAWQSFQLSMNKHPESYSLPLYALYSIIRITIAYLIALSWTLAAGIIIARSKRLSDIFLPLFDIGQSVPALALFPFVVLLLLRYVGSGIGVELASIILLLTGTQWYLLFNIIGAVRTIPGDVVEAANAFGIKDWNFIKLILLPAIFPGIIVGSIQAWGGAWNASIVSEYINFGGYVPVEVSYTNVSLDGVTLVTENTKATIKCFNGSCVGRGEVHMLGVHNATLIARSGNDSIPIPISFTAESIGVNASNGTAVTANFQNGKITLLSPSRDAVIPVEPYSAPGLGSFLDKATSEWGDPNLVVLAIATMSITILLLNTIVWRVLFAKAERYKFEMT